MFGKSITDNFSNTFIFSNTGTYTVTGDGISVINAYNGAYINNARDMSGNAYLTG